MARKSSPRYCVAALSVEIAAGAAPTALRLIPAGKFRGIDGRPEGIDSWYLDAGHAAAIIAACAARKSAYVIDFEHQTLHAKDNGKPAPAAGWFTRLEWREGDGLYAVDVEWTAEAAQMIVDRQYRYISPVFPYDKQSGAVLGIACAGLTNTPGLDGLTDLAALAQLVPDVQPTQENHMDELLEQLRWMLNLPVGATADDVKAQLQKLMDQLKSGPAQAAASFDLAAHLGTLNAELASLRAAAPDPARYVEIAVMSAVQTENTTLKTEIAELRAQQHNAQVDGVVTEALASGKLNPAQEKWARELGRANLATLTSYLEVAVAGVVPGTTQTGGKAPAGQNPAQLSDTALAVCKQLGISPEDYAQTEQAAA